MKRLRRIFDGIYAQFKSHRVLFCLMIAGILASSSMLIYFYGNFAAYKHSMLDAYSNPTRYGVLNNNNLDYKQIAELDLKGYKVHTYSLRQYFYSYENHTVAIDGAGTLFSAGIGHSIDVEGYRGDVIPPAVVKYMGKIDFSGEDDPYVAIVPCTASTRSLTYDKAAKSYGTLRVGDIAFRIIGVSTAINTVIIPYDTFVSHFTPDAAAYYSDGILPIKESEKLRDYIWDFFGCSNLVDPYSFYRGAEREYPVFVAMFFMLYIVSLFSFTFFMEYFTEKNKRLDATSRVCGAGKNTLSVDLLLRNLVLSVGCFILSIPLHLILGFSVNLFASVRYEARDWLIMLATVTIATCIMSLPALIRLRNLNANELFRSAQ